MSSDDFNTKHSFESEEHNRLQILNVKNDFLNIIAALEPINGKITLVASQLRNNADQLHLLYPEDSLYFEVFEDVLDTLIESSIHLEDFVKYI